MIDITSMTLEHADNVHAGNMETVNRIRGIYPDVDWPNFGQKDVLYMKSRYRTEQAVSFIDMVKKAEDKDAIRLVKAYMENLPHMVTAEGHKVNLDTATDTIFATASPLYTPIFHEEVMDAVHRVLEREEMVSFGAPEIDTTMLSDGGKCIIKVRFPEVEYDIRLNKGKPDIVNPEIHFKNSYDLGWKFSMSFGAYRLVCTNGLTIGKEFTRYVKRHMPNLSIELMAGSLVKGMQAFAQETVVWKDWTERTLKTVEYDNIWDALPFSDKRREAIEGIAEEHSRKLLPESIADGSLSMWQFYNTVEQYLTHNVESEMVRIDASQKTADVFHSRTWEARN